MAKVTGIGGAILRWPDDKATDQGLTVWHVADSNSELWEPMARDAGNKSGCHR